MSAFAPGRVELLGNHTDYNEGLVLGAAIDRGLTIVGSAQSNEMISLSSDLMGRFQVALNRLEPQPVEFSWANYALGVAQELIDLGVAVHGFKADVEGNLPPRSGLSSSAAFEVATALFLLKLHGRGLPPMDLAKLCQRAEHRFVGVKSGLLDQVMSIFGRANHLIYFDTRTEQVRTITFPPDLALIIAETGRQRELARGDYNLRREQTQAAARELGVRALRDVTSADLDIHSELDPQLRRRAAHVVGESERVERAIELLDRGDAAGFGQLLNQSHESSRHNFENSTAELDILVELAQKTSGIIGARLTGAGFGGAIVAVCRRPQADAAVGQLRRAYREHTGITSEMFVCQIGDGAR
jgi:galactokinase